MLIKVYNSGDNRAQLSKIVEMLNSGGVVILPTDTTYAIACHALKERAIERICRIKGINPQKNRLSIVCYDMSRISQYVMVDNTTFKLMKRNLPGAFTFILRAGNRLPKIFNHRKEVGIRIPNNNIIRSVAQELDAPIMVTSVPYNQDDDMGYLTNPELIEERFESVVDMVVDGGVGGFEYSTVVNCIDNDYQIIRDGKGVLEY